MIGVADRYRTITGYEVTPVVGVVAPDLRLVAAESEVADVFEVPLAFLLDHANHVEASAAWRAARGIITRSAGAIAASGARPRR